MSQSTKKMRKKFQAARFFFWFNLKMRSFVNKVIIQSKLVETKSFNHNIRHVGQSLPLYSPHFEQLISQFQLYFFLDLNLILKIQIYHHISNLITKL